MLEVLSSLGVFEGKQGDLIFSYDQQSLELVAGKLVAWSIMHNGPEPRCSNQHLHKMMCGERPDLTSFKNKIFMDPDLHRNMAEVMQCPGT